MTLVWDADHLRRAVDELRHLEDSARREPNLIFWSELKRIAKSVGVDTNDPVTRPLAQLIAEKEQTQKVTGDVVRLFVDVVWRTARLVEGLQADIYHMARPVIHDQPYTG
ncbi:hypothetical protein [Mycobacteroides abscessus]|uniref:hypothetical protein n=1 Tax=Mycobacteroides abscessus TaxID=36809 RepID=UPI00092A8F59|nr:hypothetical protein [Mycobacteroides abscessus]SID06075.1 Uncharacterised protein [Mycobacteroides abscessus subsp. abscessus]SKT29337.1 Uncharacterised protein [Mycobacteroides abscessus subsp. bolletii]